MKRAVILGGGSGLRAGGSVPKQFREIHGRPLIWWSLRAFREADPDTRLIVVIHPEWIDYWRSLVEALPEEERYEHMVVSGGRDRVDSVANALDAIEREREEDDTYDSPRRRDMIAVHDGARCCVTPELIRRGWETADRYGTAVPAVPVTDSLRLLDAPDPSWPEAGYARRGSRAVDRSRYVAVQTPQVFDARLLRRAYGLREEGRAYTDDASVVEPYADIHLYEGEPANIKVTHPGDFDTVAL